MPLMVRVFFVFYLTVFCLCARQDWCVWAPSKPNETIADTEGEEVAWCTKPGHGTRLIPQGAIKGVQFLRSPSYLEVLAYIDQTMLNMQASDYGGELDPHGADLVSRLRFTLSARVLTRFVAW